MASKTLPSGPFPDCMLCKDTGLQHLPDFPPAYRFCLCKKGEELRAKLPGLADESNARELALQGLGGGKGIEWMKD